MIVVCASESPRSAIISTRSRKLSLYRRYQRTHSTMISRSKWRPLKRSSTFNMLGQVHRGLICRRICATATLRTRTIQSIASGLTLLDLSSSLRYMITGCVLAVAVIVDSLARRSRVSHGRA